MSISKEFPLGVVLSITTGILCVKDFDDVMAFADFMTGDSVYLHAMPRVADEITPVLFEQHPFLRDVKLPKITEHTVGAVMHEVAKKHGCGMMLKCIPINPEDHANIPPEVELVQMNPNIQIISVDLSTGEVDFGDVPED